MFSRLIISFLLSMVSVMAEPAQPESLAVRVIVLANSDEAESVQLARYYMEKRQVPAENLVALPMPKEESITWRQFIDAVYQPVQDELIRRDWIQAVDMNSTDKFGRKKYVITGHRMAYLVVCRGVPLRIEEDPALFEPVPPLTDHAEFRTNRGAVDSELALVVQSGYAINAFVPNPLYNKVRPTRFEEAKVVKVSRLDGPTLADALALVDNALKAERQGLIGRAYVDIGGPHPQGDKWLEEVAKQLEALNYDLDVDRSPGVFPVAARFDAPVLYFGWYAGSPSGAFAQPGFHFAPGAIALHIHSYSAQTVRSTSSNWVGPLVARGVTATFGNVHEPYLPFTHNPEIILRALADGKTLGDAACLAIPAFSWQGVVIGDPLYRPFALSFADQWQRRHELSDEAFAYVVGRETKRLVKLGQDEAAIKTAQDAFGERPSLVLAWRLAELSKEAKDADFALRALDQVMSAPNVAPSLVPVVSQVAQYYAGHDEAMKALELYRRLLAMDELLPEQRLALLGPAMKVAETLGASDVLGMWKQTLSALKQKTTDATK